MVLEGPQDEKVDLGLTTLNRNRNRTRALPTRFLICLAKVVPKLVRKLLLRWHCAQAV